MGRLAGKVAIITGAGSGIGRGAARLFAAEHAKVIVADIDQAGGQSTASTIVGLGGEAYFVHADIARTDDVVTMIRFATEKCGRLDILLNNASLSSLGLDAPVTLLDEESWDKIHSVTLRGSFLCCKYGIPEMVKSGGGSIINIASATALIGTGGRDAYTAAKGGLVALTRSMAFEYGSDNIRVNCICPGAIMTPRTEEAFRWPGALEVARGYSPLGSIGYPEDIAYATLYLASEESRFVTGQIIAVDGGWTAH